MEPQTPQFGKKPVDFSKAPEGLQALERMTRDARAKESWNKPGGFFSGKEYDYPKTAPKDGSFPEPKKDKYGNWLSNSSKSGAYISRSPEGNYYTNHVRKIPKGSGGGMRGGGVAGGFGGIGLGDQIK